jgi:hypothetical protein
MAFFRISTHVEDGDITVRLNDNCIPNDTSAYETQIETHTEYIVQWFVQGPKGSKYTVIISNPREAEFQLTQTLGNSGKDFGGFRFTL